MDHSEYLAAAVALSAEALDREGTEPFGAVVVKDGRIVGRGLNSSRATFDPTSHGETEAIRDACRNLGTLDLTGATLYSSCEPCALCVAAMGIAGIEKLYYANRLADSREILGAVPVEIRKQSDIERLRAMCAAPAGGEALGAERIELPEARAVLERWAALKTG